MNKGAFILFFCIYFVQLNAQIVTEKAEQRLNNTLPKTVLDHSIATIYYQFSQQVLTGNNKPIILTDTTVLEVGNIYSVYYNWSSALRDSIFSAKALSITPQQVKEISVIGMIFSLKILPGIFQMDSLMSNKLTRMQLTFTKTGRLIQLLQLMGIIMRCLCVKKIFRPCNGIFYPIP